MKESDRRAFLDKTFDGSLDAIIFTDEKGYITEANKAFTELTGYNKEEIIGKHTVEFSPMKEGTYKCTTGELIQIDKKFSDYIKSSMDSFLEKGKLHNIMGFQLRKDGKVVPVEDNMVFLLGDNGERIGAFAVIRDITEREKILKESRESKEFLENIIESSLDGIVVSDSTGYIVRSNKAFLKMLGYREEEVIGKHIIECSPLEEGNYNSTTGELIQINDAYFKSVKTSMASFLHDGKVINRKTFYLTKDKKLFPAEDSLVFLFDTKGDRIGAVAVIRDITERRQAEELLRESEEKYHNLIEHANDAIVSINTSGMIIGFNKKAEKVFGYSREEVMGKPSYLLISQQNKEIYKEALKQFSATGTGIERDNNILEGKAARKGGEEFQVEYSYYTIDIKGEVVATSIIRDITQRKLIENELRESEERYRQLLETANDAIFIADANTGIIINANKKAEDLIGKPLEKIIGMHQTQLHSKEDAEYYERIFKEHVQRGKGVILEDVIVCHKNGQKIPTEVSASVTDFRGKKIMQGIFRDISERKKAERAIKEGKEFLESVIENSRDGIAITDTKGNILSVNNALVKMCIFSKEELVGQHSSILTIDDKELRKRILKKAGELFETGFASYESKHKAREGGYIDVECSNAMIKDSEGNYIAGVSIIRDITERKKAENQIRVARDYLENIFKASADGILVTDHRKYITMVNQATAKMLGYSQEELLGKYIGELNPKGNNYEERAKEFVTELFEKGIIANHKHSWLRKDGSIIDCETSIVLFKDEEGNVSGSVGSVRDITERKHSERKIIDYQNQLRSLASQLTTSEEQNRQNFATFLHDRIGQALFVSKLKLEMLQKSKSLEENKESSKEILTTITQLMKDTRSLTSELSPPILHELGLGAGLAWLAEQVSEREDIIVQFEDDKHPKSLSKAINSFIFSAVRELLINVTKHARAQNVKVSIQSDETSVRICVEDDGIGFNTLETTSPLSNHNTFGLFSIKERLNSVGGHLEINSTPGHGTRIILHIPHEKQ